MAGDKQLYAFELKGTGKRVTSYLQCESVLLGFWMDVGQPKDYLKGMSLYLNYVRHSNAERLSRVNGTVGNVLLVRNYLFTNGCREEVFFIRIQALK